MVDRHVWLSEHCRTFSLSSCFGPKYPFGSPVVVFQVDKIPVPPHAHVYTYRDANMEGRRGCYYRGSWILGLS